MSVPLTINGVTFQYPQEFDKHWGPTLTNWSTAVTNALKPLTGGFLSLPYPTSGIVFENSTNTGTLALTVNGSNQLTFNGVPIGATTSLTNGHIYVGNVTNNPADVAMTGDITISNTGVTTLGALKVTDSQISATAGIALSKLASTSPYFWYTANSLGVLTPIGVTASKVVITDANGLPSASTVTPTTLAFLDATSSVQTQLNNITTGFLPLSGGTMSGAISMASNKITSLQNGSSSGDAVAFGQLISNNITGTTTNDNAPAGKIGEYIISTVLRASAVSLTSATYVNITSISLTAGDWDVTGIGGQEANTSTPNGFATALSAFSGNTTTDHIQGFNMVTTPAAGNGVEDGTLVVPSWRVSIVSPTTIFLKMKIDAAGGNPLGYGTIFARRAR